MPRLLGPLVLLAAIVLPAASAEDPKDAKDAKGPKWTVAGLSVMKGSPAGVKMSPNNPWGGPGQTSEGTRVTAQLELPGRVFLSYNPQACKVASFTDDKNTDLLKKADVDAASAQRVSGSQFATDGSKVCAFTFHAPGRPGPGATSVRLKGSVVVVAAGDEKEVEKKDASLKAGVDLEVGKITLTESADGFGGATRSYVNYQGTKPLKQLRLLDADGKEIALRRSSGPLVSPKGVAAGREYTARFIPADRTAKIDRCTVRVAYLDTIEQVTVPAELEAGLGL